MVRLNGKGERLPGEQWLCSSHRSIQDHPRYRQRHWFRVFADMEMLAAHRGYKKEFDGKIIFVDGEVSWEGRPGSKGRLFTVHGYLDRQRNENRTANSLGKLELSRTANEQRTNSDRTAIIGAQQWNNGNKANNDEEKAKGHSLASFGDGSLAGPLGSVLSSPSSRKEEGQEPTWFYEIRRMYPGTTVDNDLKRIEEWARKKKKEFTRDLALNALRRNPPKKPGQRYGYVYRGKFIGNKDANALAVQNPEVLLNAKRAIRHADGQIEYEAALRAS